MKNKTEVLTYTENLKQQMGGECYEIWMLLAYLSSFITFNMYYFGFPKILLGHIVFFSLFIFPFGIYLFYKFRVKTLAQRVDFFSSKHLIYFYYSLICMIFFHVYFWPIGQLMVYYFFVTDLVLILLCLVGSYIFHSDELFTKWHQENIKIDGNKVFVENLHYINGAYEKPKNFILAKIRSIFIAVLTIIAIGFSGLGGATWPVLSRLLGGAFTEQIDLIYVTMYVCKTVFLVTCASIIYPTMYYWVWWRATRKGIVEKYGSIEIDCSDVDVIRYR